MMAVAKQEDPVFLPQSLQTDKYSTLIYIYIKILKQNQSEQGSSFQYFVTVCYTPSKLSSFCLYEMHTKAKMHSPVDSHMIELTRTSKEGVNSLVEMLW